MQVASHCSRRSVLQIATATSLSLVTGVKSTFAESPLDGPFDRLVKSHGFTADGPGLAVLVQQKDQPAFMRCVGLATLHDHKKVTPQTMFELASVSKSMTATAILILHEQKRLDVADDIRKHLPEIPDYDPKRPITIADLMHHVSGLASYLDFENVPAKNEDRDGKPYWLSSDYVGEFARQKIPLDFPTGKKYEYNNTNYTLLAVIIERVTGKSFGKFMRDAIFEPAGMKTTFVNEGLGSVPESSSRIDAIGYEFKKGKWQETWGTPPHRQETLLTVGDGAIWCSLEDMAAWDAALQTHKLLRPRTMRLGLRPSKTDNGKVNSYGFGWSLYYNKPEKLNGYGHTGSWGGFGTYYYHDLNTKRTIVFLGNGRDFDGDKFWEDLTKLVEESRFK
jgi:CubicO group peptidase (beta-lactamase class C family)